MSDTHDTSDPKALRAAIKADKSKEAVAKEGLRQIMSTEPGRAWLHQTLLSCHPFHSPFDPNLAVMAFSCGESNIGLQLIAEMQSVSPELYLQMMKENNR